MPEQAQSAADPQAIRKLAASLFNRTWELLDKPERTAEDIDEMIHSAHASRLHWSSAGTAENWLIGDWQISRVYSVLRRFEPARFHAERALAMADRHAIAGFNRACCFEALARAWALQDAAQSRRFLAEAQRLAETITDPECRKILEEDLRTVADQIV